MMQRDRTQPPARAVADDEEDQYDGPSKSQLKRDMHALQKLGVELAELPKDALKKMPMPESLDDAIRAARRITAHEGKRRQMQYVGKVMRNLHEEEVAALRAALDVYHGASKSETAKMHAIERWRERLLADDHALTEFVAKYPSADVQTGRNLIRNTRRDAEQQRPPKHFRELFQWIKTAQTAAAPGALEAGAEGEEDDDDDDY
jgi:ribosome-associated protein